MKSNIVDIDSPVVINEIPKKAKYYDIFRRMLNLIIGSGITYYLCDNCLLCNNCHIVVTVHMSVISLSCFLNFGLPVDKLVKIDSAIN